MSDALGDALRNAATPSPSPSVEPPAAAKDEDALDLLGASVEPTDDSPTVISKMPQPQTIPRAEDNLAGGLRGRLLAHFELIEPIGVGGMAAVLRARDTQLDRMVALKILPREMAADPENVRRFHQEARSAARLDHENIARVFFCGEDQRLHFIAFEFVEGDNLRTILEKRGRLPVGEALHYMLQVAAGLAHAARRGVVHRDIKPSNIIITPNGRAKLVDMGLARSLEPRHDQGLTQSGVTLGTFDYISPEQALEPRDADVRSDIYSLGCTFYHMLTGQAPVPEGTAAKKLHHHQHVKPPDPRQYVPDLPDEVAIILDRMMAKEPKDRYQAPEHLVHHLYLAARKLGAGGEVPEGVLAVEAALPSPPAVRPLFLFALAFVAVIALVFFLDSFSAPKPEATLNLRPNPSDAVSKQASDNPNPSTDPKTTIAEEQPPLPILQPTTGTPVFKKENPTTADLRKFLELHQTATAIILELDDLVFRDREPDLVVTNPEVAIRPRKPRQQSTIRDLYRALPGSTPQTTLTIKSKSCTIENMRFVLDQTGASVPMAMLRFHNAEKIDIRRCEFIQIDPRSRKDNSRMTSILAESDRPPATLRVTKSCFLGFGSMAPRKREDGKEDMVFFEPASGGQDAITRRGPIGIEPSDCLFGPHAAALRLEGGAPGDSGLVRMKHCTVLAASSSSVYDVADGADAQIDASFSLFASAGEAGMMMEMDTGNTAVLLRRASSRGRVSYRGHENRYYDLNYLAAADAAPETAERWLDDMDIKRNEELEKSPWKEPQPLERLKDQVKPSALKAAFEVKWSLPELRVRSRDTGNGQLIGAERVLAFCYLDGLPPLLKSPLVPAARERIVRKGVQPDDKKLVFPTLKYALVEAKPGEIIRLQLDGEVKFDPRWLSHENTADLTIRADRGFHPVLTLETQDQSDVSAWFEVYKGKLRLEGLEVRLSPRGDSKCGALISFLGDGECVLKNCLITLERSSPKTVLALLPRKKMGSKLATPPSPRLVVENCFIRGQGDLMSMKEGHSAEVTIENSLVALSGSLLNVESDQTEGKDEQLAPDASLTLHLQKVTTYLGENLIRLHAAQDIKGLPRTRCEAADCLFLSALDRALVRLEGPEGEKKRLREKFSWYSSSGKNAYGNFAALLEQQPIDEPMMMPLMSNQDAWQHEVSLESNSRYNVKLSDPPAADAPFTQFKPRRFRPADGLKDCGADLAALAALPALIEKTGVPESDVDESDFNAEIIK
jgi:serine/threonine protein kinase